MIPAIVLAAGESSRMGRAKALLPAGERTFVRRILETLRAGGIVEAVVVVRDHDTAIAQEIAATGFGRAVANPRAEQGQLTSLIAGLDAVETQDVDAVLVTLVDVPLFTAATVRTLCERAPVSAAAILRAAHQGRHGHPVIFKRPVFAALRGADPAHGAKPVVRANIVENVETGDAGVAEDVDTPEDYARLFSIGRTSD